MKIESGYKTTTYSVSPKPSPQPGSATASAAQDAVSLSETAGSLQANDGAPINKARIQEIKQAISEGKFKINPEAIADRLIDSARELLNASGQRHA